MNQYVRSILSGAALALLIAGSALGQSNANPKRLAVVNGETVTDDQVKAAAAGDLETLDLRKAQAAIEFERDGYAIYEKALNGVVNDKIIDAEARKRGVTTQALLTNEVDSKVTFTPQKDVDAFFEANKSRINVTGDEANNQIRAYLMQQQRDTVYETFIAKLRKDYNVETFLEPQRTPIATAGFPATGPATAAVTIVEFSDFECPYCGALFPVLQQIEANYKDRVRVVFREFPLTSIHPHAQKAAEASLCANDQQKFWELHDAMFKDNKNLDVDALKLKASALKLDTQVFNECLDSAKHADWIKKDVAEGIRAGVTGTPAMFINGRFLNGVHPYEEISKIIDEELLKAKK